MFLFTPSVRTEGGTAQLASSASPGITPKLPAGRQSEGAKGPRGQEQGLWVHRGPRMGSGLGLAQGRACGGLQGVTCPQGAWLGGPQSWPDGRLSVGAGAQGSHAELLPAEAEASRSWACDIIRGLDSGWDPVPSQSLSTFQGLPAGRARSLWLAGKGSGSHKPSSSLPKSPVGRADF